MDQTLPFASEQSDAQLEAQYQPAFDNWKKSPSPQTKSELLRAVDPIISTAVRSYGGPSRGSPVLRSQARRMALQAFDSYDSSRGTLKTHLLSNLRRLQRTGAQQAQIIRLPEQVALDRRHLDETENELRYELGREPSDMEIADRTGLSVKRISYIRQAVPVASSGQIEAASEQGEMPASMVPGQDPQGRAWESFIYADLSPTDQAIFDMMLGRHGRKRRSVKEIADRLGITPSAISQRTKRIQQLLDERFTTGLF